MAMHASSHHIGLCCSPNCKILMFYSVSCICLYSFIAVSVPLSLNSLWPPFHGTPIDILSKISCSLSTLPLSSSALLTLDCLCSSRLLAARLAIYVLSVSFNPRLLLCMHSWVTPKLYVSVPLLFLAPSPCLARPFLIHYLQSSFVVFWALFVVGCQVENPAKLQS